MHLRHITIAALLGLALVLAGCSGESAPDSAAETPAAGSASESAGSGGGADVDISGVEGMALEARDALPEGFPIEIPVIEGQVTAAEMMGAPSIGPWHVDVASPIDPDTAAAWYVQRFEGRSWIVITELAEDGRYEYTLEKGAGAWATLRIDADGDGCTIECWAGIGVSVPEEAIPPSALPGVGA